jgi:hypothetical protein
VGGIAIHIDHIEQVTITGPPAPALRWHVGPVQPKARHSMPIEISLSNEEKVRVSVAPTTPGGQPAPTDGPAQFSIEGNCTVEPIDDLSCWVISGSAVGDSVLTAAVDADLGSGIVPLADTATIHVANPMAANLGMQADQPELKNPPA